MSVSSTKLLKSCLPSNRLHQSPLASNRFQSREIGLISKIEALGKTEGQEDAEDDFLSSFTKRRGGRTKKGIEKMSPKDWLLSEEGLKFRHPIVGRTNWLGDEIPFPTNPWFKPKPPLSDKNRTKIYDSFKQRVKLFVQRNSLQTLPSDEKKRQEQILIRETSEQWGICRDQISAIIRLKAMEDSWSVNNQTEAATPPDHRRTLQLNFEKGMESVLGVNSDQLTRPNLDINDLANRRLERKSKFYGTQFVPLDSPPINTNSTQSETELKHQRPKNKQRYQEPDEPTETRHMIGTDGIPRPSTSYISKPPGKVPMVFTDVSKFPRAPKPMSKAKAKYYPKTSLLPDYQAMQSKNGISSGRRSHFTIASSSSDLTQSSIPNKSIGETNLTADHRDRIEEQKKNLASRLLRQLKGCSNSENGLKLLNQITNSTDGSKFIELTGLDPDEIKEKLLLQAGGFSFQTLSTTTKSTTNRDNFLLQQQESPNNSTTATANQSPISEDEKEIRSIKFDMMKSIYLKKLELNSTGRLLLPESIRLKEEQDLKILRSSTTTSSSSSSITSNLTNSNSSENKNRQVGNRSNHFIRQCMKGPLGR